MAIRPFVPPTGAPVFTIYADPNKLTRFVRGLMPKTQGGLPPMTSTVKGHIRRRYPGDPGYGVVAHSRETSGWYMKSGTSVTPGSRIWFEQEFLRVPTANDPSTTVVDATQFTYTGSFPALLEYVVENAVVNCVLRRESGTSTDLTASGIGGN